MIVFDHTDPALLGKVRNNMVRFARARLGSDDEAEDAVQDAFAGAAKNAPKFRGESALETWLIAILKNKVTDILRQRNRRPIIASDLSGVGPDDALAELFERRSVWRDARQPAGWENPEAALHAAQFQSAFSTCLDQLPSRQSRVFMQREIDQLDAAELSHKHGLSVANIYVIIHRARLALRDCMRRHWLHGS